MFERDIEEMFEFDGRRFQIICGTPCDDCVFLMENGEEGCNAVGLCDRSRRSDGKSVVAIEIFD